MNLLRKVFTKALSRTVWVGSAKRFVFLYHDVSDPDAPQHSEHYSTRIEKFREQIELLEENFKIVSLEEIVSESPNGRDRLASLTFDDGFLSVKEEVFPYLSAKGIPFAVFVNSAAVKHNRLFYGQEYSASNRTYDRKVFLDENDIKYLDERGEVIGSHSSAHKVLSECGDEELKEEVLGNKLYIESLLGKQVRHFALPFGKREHYDERVLQYCHSVGHDYVYSTNPSYFSSADPSFSRGLIPRISLLNQSREETLFYINRPLFKKIDI